VWSIDQFNSRDHFPTSRDEHFDTVHYGFMDRYSPERRLLLNLCFFSKMFYFYWPQIIQSLPAETQQDPAQDLAI
jgi:hypothetical protein